MQVLKYMPLILLALAAATAAQADPPAPDFTHVPAYIQALEQAHDPQSLAIQKEIAAGPTALASERDAAKAAGVALDTAFLQRPLPPPDQNAAPIYEQLKAIRTQSPLRIPTYARPLSYGYAYTSEQLSAVQQAIDSRPDIWGLIHQAADKPFCVFPRAWSQTPDVGFPQVANLRADANQLKTESFLLAAQGNYPSAIRAQALGLRMAQHAASEPLLINYLIAVVITNTTISGLNDILMQAGPNAVVDTQMQETVLADRPTLSLKAELTGQLSLMLSELEFLKTDPARGVAPGPSAVPRTPWTPHEAAIVANGVDAAEAREIAMFLPLIAAAEQPEPGRRAVFTFLTPPQNTASVDLDPIAALDALFTYTNFKFLDQIDDKIHAQEQITLAAAAVLAAKARTGAFPATLPGAFLDPFSAKALGYRREGTNGFVIYSVGQNGTADGKDPFGDTALSFHYPGPPQQSFQTGSFNALPPRQ